MADENVTETTDDAFDPDFVQKEIIPMLMSDNAYDIMKWIVQYILPGLGFLYVIIAAAANLPYVEVVTVIVFGLDWFLGIILGISTKQYNKYIMKSK